MSINVKCPNRSCDQQLSLSPEMAGKKGKCPKCGKTFQIPAKLGEKATKKPATKPPAQKTPASKPTPKPVPQSAPKPAPPPPEQEMAADELAGFLVEEEEEIIEGAEIIESFPPESAAPASQGYDDDAFDDPFSPQRRDEDMYGGGGVRKGAISKSKKWSLVSIGFLIVAISVCVYAGSFVMLLMSEGFFQLAAPARSANMAKASVTLMKVGGIFGLIASVGMVTGYVFFVFVPNKNATLGLSIATLSLGVVNFVLGLIFRVIPAFSQGSDIPHFRTFVAGMVGGLGTVGHEIFMMFLEFGIAAEFMLLALFMAAVAKSHNDRRHKNDCMRMVWFLTAFAGVVLVMSVFMFLDVTGKWQFYTVRVFNWAANGLLGATLVFMIMNLFFSRKETK